MRRAAKRSTKSSIVIRVLRACALAAIALAIALAIAGCGGGSNSTAAQIGGASSTASKAAEKAVDTIPEPTTESVPQFIAKADAICARLNTKLAAVTPKGTSAKEVAIVVARHAALEREGLAELEKLAPPVTLLRDWRRIRSERRLLIDELNAFERDARRGDVKGTKPLVAAKRRLHKALEETAKGAGFKDCGKVG